MIYKPYNVKVYTNLIVSGMTYIPIVRVHYLNTPKKSFKQLSLHT